MPCNVKYPFNFHLVCCLVYSVYLMCNSLKESRENKVNESSTAAQLFMGTIQVLIWVNMCLRMYVKYKKGIRTLFLDTHSNKIQI